MRLHWEAIEVATTRGGLILRRGPSMRSRPSLFINDELIYIFLKEKKTTSLFSDNYIITPQKMYEQRCAQDYPEKEKKKGLCTRLRCP